MLAGNTTHIGTKLLKLGFCRTTVVHSLYTPDCKARISYCRWFQESLFKGILDPEITFYSETRFTLYGYVNRITDIGAQEVLMLFIKCFCMI
jgi:hypothetical protein